MKSEEAQAAEIVRLTSALATEKTKSAEKDRVITQLQEAVRQRDATIADRDREILRVQEWGRQWYAAAQSAQANLRAIGYAGVAAVGIFVLGAFRRR